MIACMVILYSALGPDSAQASAKDARYIHGAHATCMQHGSTRTWTARPRASYSIAEKK